MSASDRAPVTAELEHALEGMLGEPIATLRRRRPPYWSDFHVERLELKLASGARLKVFFKDFDVVHVPREAPRTVGAKEVAVYRLLAAEGMPGLPVVYGAVWDDDRPRHWLFLEDVGDWRLDQGEPADWVRAVRWLARLHARFADRERDVAAAVPGVRRFDAAFVEATAQRATRTLEELNPGGGDLPALRNRDMDRLRPVIEAFPSLAAHLLCGPGTLMHGDCYSYNVLLRPAGDVRRKMRQVCFVDWESAGFGPAALDLAALMQGAPSRTRLLLMAGYLDAFARAGGRRLPRPSFELAVGSFAVCDLVAGLAGVDLDSRSYASVRRRLGLPGRLVEAEQFLRAWSRRSG